MVWVLTGWVLRCGGDEGVGVECGGTEGWGGC